MHNLREIVKKINIEGPVLFDEPMKNHTTFRIGGPADIFIIPQTIQSLKNIIKYCREKNIPWFSLGHGANILVADAGIRGIVIDFSAFSHITCKNEKIKAGAGASVSAVSEAALSSGLSGLEFFYKMPGSVGGALYMNARCYGISTGDGAESAESAEILYNLVTVPLAKADFSYKKSPFMDSGDVILSVTFLLKKGNKKHIKEKMDQFKKDREKKGHFLFPSAGSVFKNNKEFGRTTGEIIDSLSLKGYSIGDARVSPYHGNIIVNQGNARARDVLRLITFIEKKVKHEMDLDLEREIILVGGWEEEYDQ